MAQRIRRVVTGHDAGGNSVFLVDGYASNVRVNKHYGGTASTQLWSSTVPADNSGTDDAADAVSRLEPAPGGTIFRIVEYPPDAVRLPNMDRDKAFREMGGLHALVQEGARHPGMHRTNTLDYAIVLSGEIYAVLDREEVLLKAGDCLIQRGTSHAWSNRTNEPCRIAFILIDAVPVERPAPSGT